MNSFEIDTERLPHQREPWAVQRNIHEKAKSAGGVTLRIRIRKKRRENEERREVI